MKIDSSDIDGSTEVSIVCHASNRNNYDVWPPAQKAEFELLIKLIDVKDIKLEFKSSLPVKIMGFDIIDISSQGFEGINYQVEDYEDQSIELSCKDCSVETFKRL